LRGGERNRKPFKRFSGLEGAFGHRAEATV
jgi:hypothetical protein